MTQKLFEKFVFFISILAGIFSFINCRREQVLSIKNVNEKITTASVGFQSPAPLYSSDDEPLHPIVDKNRADFAFPGGNSLNSRPNRISKCNRKNNSIAELKNIVIDPVNVTNTNAINKTPELVKKENHVFETPFGFVGSYENNNLSIPIQADQTMNSAKPQELLAGTVIAISSHPIASPLGTTVVNSTSINKPVLAPGTVIAIGDRRSIAPGTIISESVLAPGGTSNRLSSQTLLPGTVIGTSAASKPSQNKPAVPSPGAIIRVSTNPSTTENISRRSRSPCLDEQLPPLSNSAFVMPSRIDDLEEDIANSLAFDPSYSGPKITLESLITVEYVRDTLIPYFKSGKLLDRKSSYSLLFRALLEFEQEDNLHEIILNSNEKILIFGDIHGQFFDFIQVLEKEGLPSSKLKYLFNGDIVDRGAYSIECLLTLLALKIAAPGNFFVSLGNHETLTVGKLQFHKESIKKSFPVAYLVQKEIFVTHGGISPFVTFDRIRNVDRMDPTSADEDTINDLIWSDPMDKSGALNSHRGLGYLFGPDVTKGFIMQNNISAIIRSHQYKNVGFSEQHDGMCITIFSCPNYRGKNRNLGAYIRLDDQLNMSYHVFDAAIKKPGQSNITLPPELKLFRNLRRKRT